MYSVPLLLIVLSFTLGCGDEDNTVVIPQPSEPAIEEIKEPIEEVDDKLTPTQRALKLMKEVNLKRTEAYKQAKEKDDFTTLSETSDKIFQEVLGFEEKFANQLIAAWEGVQRGRKMIGLIDDATIKRYENFRQTYQIKFANETEEPFFEYIAAYDDIITEYLRIRFDFPDVLQEEVMQLFGDSMFRGNADIIYPEGF
jgi:hypothetical protein